MPHVVNTVIPMCVDLGAIPPSHRLSYWNEIVCANFAPADNSFRIPASEFCASVQRSDFANASICRVRIAPFLSVRDPNMMRRKPLDHFFLSYLIDGEAALEQSGRQTLQHAGDFVLYDSERPLTWEALSPCTGIWVRLPRQLLNSRLARAEAMTARRIPNTTPLAALAASFLIKASDLDLDGSSTAAARVLSSLVDLIAATFDEAGGSASVSAHHTNLLDSAKKYILANMSDPDLSCEDVVQGISVSRRTLNRLFAAEGTTPVRWMWKKRLERSRVMLESGGESRVVDVAMSCGFRSTSHFSRAFKLEFGGTPNSILFRPSSHSF